MKDQEPADLSVVEDAGIAFDPTAQHLSLSKEEKRRTTALMLAIKYHADTIVQDADMYRELVRNQAHLTPTTCAKVVGIAAQFDQFIAGQLPVADEPAPGGSHQSDEQVGTQEEN